MHWKFRNLLDGLYQIIDIYRNYLVLLGLILLSVFLLQSNENPQLTYIRQRLIFIAALLSNYSGDPSAAIESTRDRNLLRQENIELAKRNIVLEDAYLENVKLRQMLKFSARFPLQTIPAQIIFKSPNPKFSTLTLNKGSRDGVRKRQSVITDKGLVGLIVAVSEDYSECQILLDQTFRAAAKIQRTRLNGIVFWQGQPNEVGFYGVLKNLDVRVGDVILTSDYSEFFLPNFCIGVVSGINNEIAGIFKDIRVQTAVDFNRLEEVFIVTDTSKTASSRSGFENVFLGEQ